MRGVAPRSNLPRQLVELRRQRRSEGRSNLPVRLLQQCLLLQRLLLQRLLPKCLWPMRGTRSA